MTPRLRPLAFLVCLIACLVLPIGAWAVPDPTKPPELASTVAGSSTSGFAGDGGPASQASLNRPFAVGPGPGGGLLIADTDNNRIRRVAADGGIGTVAGSGILGFNGDALLPTLADLNAPRGVAATADGGYLIADTGNHRVRKVLLGGALIITVAGNGTAGYSGDGLAASLAQLDSPTAVAATGDGGFLIADTGNNRIRKVSATGLISTVAGDGTPGYGGDAGPATAAQLNQPNDVDPLADGSFLVADTMNHRVRKVAADGTITTVVGAGTAGFSGDKGPATAAELNQPRGVAIVNSEFFYVADTLNHRVRKIKRGEIKTISGDGVPGYAGDGGPVGDARLNFPTGLFRFPGSESVLVADTDNSRIRALDDFDLTEVVIPLPSEQQPDYVVPLPPVVDRELPGPRRPVVGEHVKIEHVAGNVRVKMTGRRRFVRLRGSASVPVGSVIDVRRGRVALTAARDARRTQTATFSAGRFQVRQRKSARPVTDLVLRGGSFRGCRRGSRRARRSAVVSARSRRVRRLWGRGHGRFRTHGRDSIATVRGTIWLTEDRCTGTFVAVRRGVVAVKSRRTGRTVMVRAGRSHLTRARARRR